MERGNRSVDLKPRGWHAYFEHSNPWTFEYQDCRVRGRLRNILRRRLKFQGNARRPSSHLLWHDSRFDTLGLFKLTAARPRDLQPCSRQHLRLESRMREMRQSG